MTVWEFFGCASLAFGPALAMFIITIAHDPIRIIVLIASAFSWLLSLLLSSLLWFAVVPLREHLSFGLVFSVLFQELFRYLVYRLIRAAEGGLKKITESTENQLVEKKHVLAYVSGFGFGLMSGMFALMNLLAASVGPGTMGLNDGNDQFLLISSATTLCFVLLHTFWSVIFFAAIDCKNYVHIALVVVSHLFVSCMTLLNHWQHFAASLTSCYIATLLTGILAFRVAGGSYAGLKASFRGQ